MRRGRAAGPHPGAPSRPSRSRAHGRQRFSLELEETEHVVQAYDLGVLLALLRRELAFRTLLRQLLDARRQIVADRSERRLQLLQGPLLHGDSSAEHGIPRALQATSISSPSAR